MNTGSSLKPSSVSYILFMHDDIIITPCIHDSSQHCCKRSKDISILFCRSKITCKHRTQSMSFNSIWRLVPGVPLTLELSLHLVKRKRKAHGLSFVFTSLYDFMLVQKKYWNVYTACYCNNVVKSDGYVCKATIERPIMMLLHYSRAWMICIPLMRRPVISCNL